MKKNISITLITSCILTFISCSQTKTSHHKIEDKAEITNYIKAKTPHNYGGWYCPDNLTNFPAVDIVNWKDVPVVNGRMPTKEEASNGTSLIFVDTLKYPKAKPLDVIMPKLAKFYNQSSNKEETIILIQAVNIQDDSIVGFRYLNGGNGSAHLRDVTILTDEEIKNFKSSQFVSLKTEINATQLEIWEILTNPSYASYLQPIFDKDNKLKANWVTTSKVNYKYLNSTNKTAEYAANLFGNQYIQIDWEFDNYQYVEKFILLENKQTKTTELQIVCGPYQADFEQQKLILNNWANKVKELSEQ